MEEGGLTREFLEQQVSSVLEDNGGYMTLCVSQTHGTLQAKSRP